MTIPARVHFCWIGSKLPWAYIFAILSAAARSELSQIILHHTDELEDGPELQALKDTALVTLDRIDPIACLDQAGQALDVGGALTDIYRRLDSPVMRADVLRSAILYLQGGIYLDLDTVTTQSLRPLLGLRQFVGCEFIVWPQFVHKSYSPIIWARSLILDVLRKFLVRQTSGWRMFRRVERLYYRGVNNAVMGAQAGSRLFAEYLLAMTALSPERSMQIYALGPELLQEIVDNYSGDDLTILEPRVFFPLPPRISEQWFTLRKDVPLNDVLSADTRVVHWYASVRTKSRVGQIDPAYVQAHRHDQLYSALVCSCIPDLPRIA